MNKIIKEHYPVAKLPEDLRDGLNPAQEVRITIEIASDIQAASEEKTLPSWFRRLDRVLSVEEIFTLRRPPFRSGEEIDAEIRRQRDEWDH